MKLTPSEYESLRSLFFKVAALNVAVSLYYYMRIVVAMFISEATEKTGLSLPPGLVSVLAITLIFTLLIGLYPDPFIDWAHQATAGFLFVRGRSRCPVADIVSPIGQYLGAISSHQPAVRAGGTKQSGWRVHP